MSTQNTATDFGEPWFSVSDWKHIRREKGQFVAGVILKPTQKNKIEHSADADRIVACVNACAGMQDPAAEIQAMRAAIMEAHEALSNITSGGREYYDMDMGPNGAECLNHADSALAKLQPFLK